MKKVFLLGIFTAMMIAMVSFSSCSKDNDSGSDAVIKVKLSPPAWIRGSWGVEDIEVFEFTSDDVLMFGQSIKLMNFSAPSGSISMKETKSTSSVYEITISVKSGGEKAAAIFSFKKGDGTFIDAAFIEAGETLSDDDYDRLDKM